MYRVGFPGWKLAARMGVPLLVKIDVLKDVDENVYVATSRDLDGLVVECAELNDLMSEVYECVGMLLEAQLKSTPKRKPLAAWNGDFCAA